MRKSIVIAAEIFKGIFRSLIYVVLFFGSILISIVLIFGSMMIESSNNISFLSIDISNVMVGISTTIFSFFVISWINRQIKNKSISYFLLGSTSKLKVYLGFGLGWLIPLLVAMIFHSLVLIGIFSNIGFPHSHNAKWTIFGFEHFLIIPLLIYLAIIWINYFFYQSAKGNWSILLVLVAILVLCIIRFAAARFVTGEKSWSYYLELIIPIVNLSLTNFEISSFTHIPFYVPLIITLFEFLILLIFTLFFKRKSHHVLNGKESNRFFI